MELREKLAILSAAAKYDASCASSGSRRKNSPTGTGNCEAAGICHSWSDDGRCQSLLKVLQTNICNYDCLYCANRKSNDIPRAAFTPRELADLTMEFYRRNYIEGLFLSSAVCPSADAAMERMCETLRILRCEYNFNGYIHVKGIPSADLMLLEQAGRLADRISVNLELPTTESLHLLAPDKQREDLVTPIKFLKREIANNQAERAVSRRAGYFAPAGQSTQLIIGATPESDKQIITLSAALYQKMNLRRVYYSAYMPINTHSLLPALNTPPPLWREHRLYQADWLVRKYGFTADELFSGGEQNLSPHYDPKVQWALANLHLFPLEINRAPYEMLLKVPGIGLVSARRIITARKMGTIRYEDLRKLGVVTKRAQYFITCAGHYNGGFAIREDVLKRVLSDDRNLPAIGYVQQLRFLDDFSQISGEM